MRSKIVAANWKMNLTLAEGTELVTGILAGMPQLTNGRHVVIATPFVNITTTAAQLARKNNMHAGAQNCYSEASGAFTGEVSARMLAGAGVDHVIIGHSERREYFKEDNAMLARKTDRALENGLNVIFCCGEPLSIREAGTENRYVETQIREGIFHLSADQLSHLAIAYEPIWAIGTGRTATPQQAQDMHAHLRAVIAGQYGQEIADKMPILYGGSCNAANAKELFALPDVDGGLIGGAALKADSFLAIVNAMVSA